MLSVDERLFLWINGLAGEFQPLDTFITWVVSDYLIPVGMALALVAFWFAGQDAETRRRRQVGVFAALTSMALSSWAVYIINWYYFRPRPFVDFPDQVTLLFYQPTDSSFPANAIAAASAIAIASGWSTAASALPSSPPPDSTPSPASSQASTTPWTWPPDSPSPPPSPPW